MRKALVLVLVAMVFVGLFAQRNAVGIVLSSYTAKWFAELGFSGEHWDYLGLMQRAFDFVRGLGYSVVPVFDRDLELYANPEADPVVKFTRLTDLSKVKVLLLIDLRRMSPLMIDGVRKFINEGGFVLAFSQTSFRDHNNLRHNQTGDFALSDVFQVSFSVWSGNPPTHGYIRKVKDHPIWEGLEEFVQTPRHWTMVVKVLEEADVLGEWFNDDMETPSHMPDLNAAIVEGKGAIYVGENLFVQKNFEVLEVQLLIANMIDYLMKKEPEPKKEEEPKAEGE